MTTTIELDDALNDRLEHLARLRQQPTDMIAREAIVQYVEREEARVSFKREAGDSWAHYHATGLHLTGEEVSAWLKTWGTEADSEPPECHA